MRMKYGAVSYSIGAYIGMAYLPFSVEFVELQPFGRSPLLSEPLIVHSRVC